MHNCIKENIYNTFCFVFCDADRIFIWLEFWIPITHKMNNFVVWHVLKVAFSKNMTYKNYVRKCKCFQNKFSVQGFIKGFILLQFSHHNNINRVRNRRSCNTFTLMRFSLSLSFLFHWRRGSYYEALEQLYTKLFLDIYAFIFIWFQTFHLNTIDFACILSVFKCSGRNFNPL